MQRTKVKLRKIRRRAGIHDAPNDSLSFIDIFYQYASYSKINGMYYLTRGVTSGFIRYGLHNENYVSKKIENNKNFVASDGFGSR